jgi:hypothetical protein
VFSRANAQSATINNNYFSAKNFFWESFVG